MITVAQLSLDLSHGLDQLFLLALRQALQHQHDFFTSGLLQRGQHLTTWLGELDLRGSGVDCRPSFAVIFAPLSARCYASEAPTMPALMTTTRLSRAFPIATFIL